MFEGWYLSSMLWCVQSSWLLTSALRKWKPLNCAQHRADGILQARILEWVAYPFSRGSSPPTGWTGASCRFFTNWAMPEAPALRARYYHSSHFINEEGQVKGLPAEPEGLITHPVSLGWQVPERDLNPSLSNSKAHVLYHCSDPLLWRRYPIFV